MLPRNLFVAHSPSRKVESHEQHQLYNTMRGYAQRLKEERDLSLSYLKKINELNEQIYLRDQEIQRLNKVNKELNEKLSLYSSVIHRSQVSKGSLRMSMLIDQKNMTESIYETRQEYAPESPKLFEEFLKFEISGQSGNSQIKCQYSYNQNKLIQENVKSLLSNTEGIQWEPQKVVQPYKKISSFVIFLCNSPMTLEPNYNQQILQFNPSQYYFIYCFVHKQLRKINKKHYLIPYIHCFVSLYPFPEYFKNLLEIMYRNQSKVNNDVLIMDSLDVLSQLIIQFPSQQIYHFMNEKIVLSLPDYRNIDNFAVSYSNSVVGQFAVQLIIDVLLLLLLEIPITIICSNQQVLNKFMFEITYFIKPFKYPYPIVFNLTSKLIDLMESPFPTFIGTTQQAFIQNFLKERAVFDLDKRVARSWPIIDYLDRTRNYILQIIGTSGSKRGAYTVIDLLISDRNEIGDMQAYSKDFKRTQIYQNFLHRI